MMSKDVLFDEVMYGNKRIKMIYKRKSVGLPSTVRRQRDSNIYRVVEVAGRL